MTSKPIPPILFKAFVEGSVVTEHEPDMECFNAGLSGEDIDSLATPYKPSKWIFVSLALICLGALPIVLAALMVFFMSPFLSEMRVGDYVLPEPLASLVLPGLGLTTAGILWKCFLSLSPTSGARKWQKDQLQAWQAHGARVFVLTRIPYEARTEVQERAVRLEEIRKGLNRLDPVGDELDGARYAMERFIEASDIPLLGARAAGATHIKDPKVRQAAKEYEQAVKAQEHWRKTLDGAIGIAKELLAERRQARTDAEIIRLVNER